MKRFVLFGNSGSGKSTLARALAERLGRPHLDLDTVAWGEPTTVDGANVPTRRALEDSAAAIDAVLDGHDAWVVEGCYADLLELVLPRATEVVFLDPGIAACQENCRRRPFEPHKYATPAEQDANLPMLLAWVAQYEEHDDEFSAVAHRRLFDGFGRRKWRLASNAEAAAFVSERDAEPPA